MLVTVDSWAWLDLNQLDPAKVFDLKRLLTLHPRKVGDHPGPAPEPLKLFTEKPGFLGVPREFFLKSKARHEVLYHLTEGDKSTWPGDLTLQAELRPEQVLALNVVAGKLTNGDLGGILRAPPGWGKTVWACALMAKLQVPTLVVVHKEFLLTQWRDRIQQFLPSAKIGICQQNDCEYGHRHVVIGMVQSLSQKGYPSLFYQWPGLVLTDEVHRIGAETWSQVPPQFRSRWRVGLSATPRRKDGCEDVFLHHIGPLLFTAREQRLLPKIKRVWTSFKLVRTEHFDPEMASRAILLRILCKDADRNHQVVEQLVKAAQVGRKILILSERLAHLDLLRELFDRMWTKTTEGLPLPSHGLYVGGMDEDSLRASSECQLIFATSQMVSEGLDIPALDTLALTTPLADIEQAVGRILRPWPGKKEPIVVDFIDRCPSKYVRMADMRERQYRQIIGA